MKKTGFWVLCGAMLAAALALAAAPAAAVTLDIDFNSGLDNDAGSSPLVYAGPGGFLVMFTDDESNGTGGNAEGVHVTNQGYGNSKAGSPTDFVLGAFNSASGSNNTHTSGIVAGFSQGVTSAGLFDSDDDATFKTLFAFDELGSLIGQTAPGYQTTFAIDTSMTGGQLIHSVEFDTQAGTAGGSFDGTYFTLDDFTVTYDAAVVPEPGGLGIVGLAMLATRRRRRR